MSNNINKLINYVDSLDNNNETNYRTKNVLNISKMIYELEVNNIVFFKCKKFSVIKKYVTLSNNKMRSYLIKISNTFDYTTPTDCTLFFHGSRDLHWDVALISTNMLNDNFLTVYLQGNNQGSFELEMPHLHKFYNYVSYGENFFEIRDYVSNFNEDIEYVKLVKNTIIETYQIKNFNAVGHSNGGVFVCLFPVYLPNEFNKIVSHQGGMGWDEYFNIPFEKLDEYNKRNEKMYFYTGSEDIHKVPCIQAHNIFTNEGYKSVLYIEPNLKHTWNKSCENKIFEYLNKDQ